MSHKSVPVSIAYLLLGQIVAFTLCQFLVINFTNGYCTNSSYLKYDNNSPFACHDQFDPIVTGVAIVAILFDAILFSLFCSKWYAIMLIFMEEMAISLLIQFSLICIAMASCVMDALFHSYFVYANYHLKLLSVYKN